FLQRLAVAVTPVLEKLRYVVGQILSVAISARNNSRISTRPATILPLGPPSWPTRKGTSACTRDTLQDKTTHRLEDIVRSCSRYASRSSPRWSRRRALC